MPGYFMNHPGRQTNAPLIGAPMRRILCACASLVVLTVATYWPIRSAGFINFDDLTYVTNNPHVLGGFSWPAWRWAWTTFDAHNWHPLTWLSLQLDAQLYGSRAAGFHTTNVALHLGSSLLMYGWLRQLLRSDEVSFLAAALFAVHPLHVESVAWVAERKDVLSSFFGMAALWAYTGYARRRRLALYGLTCLLFALSLLAKPMWVTFPMLLLLLDIWPLNDRLDDTGSAFSKLRRWRVLEKTPFLILTAVSCIATVLAQEYAMRSWKVIPLGTRIGTAVTSYVVYLQKTFWPTGLAIFYPYPNPPYDWLTVLGAALLLSAITLVGIVLCRRRPAILIGWLWYLGTLVPVIGLLQVGDQARADRYAYLPHIGLFFAWIWEFRRVLDRGPAWTRWRWTLGGLSLLACALLTHTQLGYWQSSEAIWRHTLAVTHNNATAHNQLGALMNEQWRFQEAEAEFARALNVQPDLVEARFNLGIVFNNRGQHDQAEFHFRKALELDSDYVSAHQELGVILAMSGRTTEAIEHLSRAARLLPESLNSWMNLATAQVAQKDYQGAIESYMQAVRLQPNQAPPLILLAAAEFEAGRIDDGREHYRQSLAIDPRWPDAMNADAWNRATNPDSSARNGAAALQLARKVCQATNDAQPQYLETLAAAYAEVGRFDDAVEIARRAISLYTEQRKASAAGEAQSRLKLFEKHQPYRLAPGPRIPGR